MLENYRGPIVCCGYAASWCSRRERGSCGAEQSAAEATRQVKNVNDTRLFLQMIALCRRGLGLGNLSYKHICITALCQGGFSLGRIARLGVMSPIELIYEAVGGRKWALLTIIDTHVGLYFWSDLEHWATRIWTKFSHVVGNFLSKNLATLVQWPTIFVGLKLTIFASCHDNLYIWNGKL